MIIIKNSDPFGWKIEVDGEELDKWYQAKINALNKAEELADDVSDIEVETISGETQVFDSWSSLKSAYR